jgi:hypothetical protein
MKITVPGLGKIAQHGRLNRVKIFVGNLAAIGFDDIIKAALFVQSQHQRTIFFVIAERILHLIPVTKKLGAGDNPLIGKTSYPGLLQQV